MAQNLKWWQKKMLSLWNKRNNVRQISLEYCTKISKALHNIIGDLSFYKTEIPLTDITFHQSNKQHI